MSKIWHCNVNGLRARLTETILATTNFDVICLQETRIPYALDSQFWLLNFPNYVAHTICDDNEGVGIAMLVRRDVKHEFVCKATRNRHRLISIKLLNTNGDHFMLSSLYAPPAGHGILFDSDLLAQALAYRHALVIGDLNARSTELGCKSSNSHGHALQEAIENDNYIILNNPQTPTFAHSAYAMTDCLDWAISTPDLARAFNSWVSCDIGSDHRPITVVPLSRTPRNPTPSDPPKRWRTSHVKDWTAFTAELDDQLHINFDDLLNNGPNTTSEIEHWASAVTESFQTAANKVLTPSRPFSHNGTRPLPWWLRVLINERRRILRRYCREPSNALRRELNKIKRTVRAELLNQQDALMQQRINNLKAGPSNPQFWPEVKRWFSTGSAVNPPLVSHIHPNNLATLPKERAEAFAIRLSEDLTDRPNTTDFDNTFRRQIDEDVKENAFFDHCARGRFGIMSNVSSSSVSKAIKRLRPGRAPGPDGISSDLLKNAPPLLATILANLFSASLHRSYFPCCWKQAYVKMIPKTGKDNSLVKNYRPISLTSALGKLLERIFTGRLMYWCDQKALLPVEQSGFRATRDAQEQVTLLVQRANEAMNGGLTTVAVSLDVSKAFDSVWHNGLLHRLYTLLPSSITKWIASFLHSRRIQILEDGFLSDPIQLTQGVPQGSPLSPLLYTLYTSTIPLPDSPLIGASLFADDIAVWASAPSPTEACRQLQPILNEMCVWGRKWRLAFSAEKTQAIYFTRRHRWPPDARKELTFDNGTTVPWSQHLDFLGVRLDRELSLRAHAIRVANRLGPRMLEFNRLCFSSCHVPVWVLVCLFRSFFRSSILYGAPIILLGCEDSWQKMERVERRALRACLRSRWRGLPVSSILRRTKIKPLREAASSTAGAFLLRHTENKNRRLLTAFLPAVPQHPRIIHLHGPLERAFAGLPTTDQRKVTAFLQDVGFLPDSPDPGGTASTVPPVFPGSVPSFVP